MMLELKLPYMITSAIYVSAIIISTFGIRFCLIEDCGTGLYYITYTIIISSTIITVLISKYVIPFFSKLRQKVVKSKANRIIIIAYLGMLLLAIPLLPWLLAGSYSNAWIFYLVFFIVPGIPFAIIILLIIFKMEISRMKWWKRLSLYCCIILLLAGIIYCGVMGWAVAIHLFT